MYHKLLILPTMNTLPGGSTGLIGGTRSQIHNTFRVVIQQAIAGGDLRAGTNPDEIIRAFIGIFHTTSLPGWEASAPRIVDILLDVLCPRD